MTMKPNGESRELVPTNGRHLPCGFPDDVVTRALALVVETGSVAEAWRVLQREMTEGEEGLVPDYKTVWMWARQHEDVIRHIQTNRKREMQAIASDVAVETADRALRALEGLSDGQVYVPYGIAMQRVTDLYSDRGGPVAAVQFNLVTRRKEED